MYRYILQTKEASNSCNLLTPLPALPKKKTVSKAVQMETQTRDVGTQVSHEDLFTHFEKEVACNLIRAPPLELLSEDLEEEMEESSSDSDEEWLPHDEESDSSGSDGETLQSDAQYVTSNLASIVNLRF